MTGPEHYRRAEELAAEAHRLLGQATAGAWATVAQTHAVLALAAATAVARPVRIPVPGPTPPGPASDPVSVIVDA